jgi:hypothetical protein
LRPTCRWISRNAACFLAAAPMKGEVGTAPPAARAKFA